MLQNQQFVAELQVSQTHWRHVFSTVHEGIWFIDGEARTTFVNARMAEMLGYTPDEMMGRSLFEFLRDDDRPSVELHFRQRQRGIRAQYDFRYRRKDGSDLWTFICTNPMFDEHGAFVGVLGMHTDITEKKKMEERLYELSAIVEDSSDAIACVGLDGTIMTWNAAAARIRGYEAEEVIGRSIFDFTPPDRMDEMRETFHRVKAGETVRDLETERVRKDGVRIVLEISMSPVQNASGTISHFTMVCRDITRRKEEQEALRQSQRMEAVCRLAGGISHDFNNALAVIMGHVSLMARQPHLTPRLEASIESIKAASEQAQALVRELLTLSQKQIISPRLADLNSIVHKTQEALRRMLEESVVIELDLAPLLGPVWADPSLIEQALINLALNARDAMGGQGTLRIVTREVDVTAAQARQWRMRGGRAARLSVVDGGSGIQDRDLPHIFEPFFTTRPSGHGLGLATAEGIVRQSGGHIAVTTQVGKGSTFAVLLPVARDVADGVIRSDELPRGTETILLVDDHALVRSTTRQMLTHCGYHVLEAGRADEAVALARDFEGSVHLVLTDVRMPDVNGHTLVTRVRRLRPRIRVVYMSAFTDDEGVLKSVRGARAGFVQKPFTLEAVAWKVREVLDQSSPPRRRVAGSSRRSPVA